jgi:sodium bicarbonate transporter 10
MFTVCKSVEEIFCVQEFRTVSILFPVMLVVLVGIRKLLDFVFTNHELKVHIYM